MNRYLFLLLMPLILMPVSGCQTTEGNTGKMQSFSFPVEEPAWIRNGEPIEFEGEKWYPGDGMESFLDSEVYLITTYKGVQVFIDKLDVRPFERLYTKFGRNKFRYFEKQDVR